MKLRGNYPATADDKGRLKIPAAFDSSTSEAVYEGSEKLKGSEGEVDWRAFLRTLNQLNFRGDLVIEREAGGRRVADIRAAREHLLSLDDGSL